MKRKIVYAKLAILLVLAHHLLLIALIVLRPDLPVYSTTISEWAIGRCGWMMQLAFFFWALSYLTLFLAIRFELTNTWGKIGLGLLLLCFLAVVGLGEFVTDPYPPDFSITRTAIHTACGAANMLSLPAAALLINFGLSRHGSDEWVSAGSFLKRTGFIPLIVLIGFVFHLVFIVMPLGTANDPANLPVGIPPRVLFLSFHGWILLLAAKAIKIFNLKNQII